MKFKKTMRLLFAMLLLGVAFLPVGQVSADTEEPREGFGEFREKNRFFDYDAVATVDGTWGANLFEGNDQNKQFVRILPVDSQWKIYGYTRRADNYYYWAGGDLWIQADQVRVPVENDSDVLLNIVAKYGDEDLRPDINWTIGPISNGYWGNYYWAARKIRHAAGNYGDMAVLANYIVYPNGDVFPMSFEDL